MVTRVLKKLTNQPIRNDPTLIQACLDGKQEAWNALVERYERLVYSVALKARLSPSDSDDVFQSVFISLYRNLSQLKDQQRLSAWLITTTHRESWRVARRRQRTLSSEEAEALEPVTVSPDELEAQERQQLVREGLRELGGPCEALLGALFLGADEPVYDEVAKQLGIPVGSIGPTRARCLKKLEQILSRKGFTSGREADD